MSRAGQVRANILSTTSHNETHTDSLETAGTRGVAKSVNLSLTFALLRENRNNCTHTSNATGEKSARTERTWPWSCDRSVGSARLFPPQFRPIVAARSRTAERWVNRLFVTSFFALETRQACIICNDWREGKEEREMRVNAWSMCDTPRYVAVCNNRLVNVSKWRI